MVKFWQIPKNFSNLTSKFCATHIATWYVFDILHAWFKLADYVFIIILNCSWGCIFFASWLWQLLYCDKCLNGGGAVSFPTCHGQGQPCLLPAWLLISLALWSPGSSALLYNSNWGDGNQFCSLLSSTYYGWGQIDNTSLHGAIWYHADALICVYSLGLE